ncbi:hypothetical protein [Paenibacillus sp. tmac-D7]|uniref:hypothetical protein n=1 Tax=Paenibacillus sp. tmac-D7 TaxID=2591462 RepID=UPI0011414272|nr:hypothetical protein [Paenibacillus sp. tmac-D7]
MNQTTPFSIFEQASTDQELQQFRQTVVEGGFTAFRLFLEGFRDLLKRFEDGEIERVNRLLAAARQLFPEPGRFSPSWVDIWNEFEQIAQFKQTVLESIVGDDRAGEWQILIDNPYTNTDLACYPSLTFLEGAYLYAYFRSDLKQNEFIRLQKIQNVIMAFGSERSEPSKKKA